MPDGMFERNCACTNINMAFNARERKFVVFYFYRRRWSTRNKKAATSVDIALYRHANNNKAVMTEAHAIINRMLMRSRGNVVEGKSCHNYLVFISDVHRRFHSYRRESHFSALRSFAYRYVIPH